MADGATVTVEGIPETTADLHAAAAAVHTPEGMGRAADLVAEAARGVGPDRTGALSASYRGEWSGDIAGVTTSLVYGTYVEYGTRYMRAQKRVERAFASQEQRIESELEAVIEQAYASEVTAL